MRSVTEFTIPTLMKGLQAKQALTTEGKTPEEIQASLGTTFKMEGDKLKYFLNAMDVASQNMDKLMRVRVIAFNEGESLPPKATKVEEMYYVPEFQMAPKAAITQKAAPTKGGGDRKKGKSDRPRTSPWGETPEEKAAKKATAQAAAKAASKPST